MSSADPLVPGRALIKAQRAAARNRRESSLYPGVVTAWDPLRNVAQVDMDDGGSVTASSLVGALVVGERVMVQFELPRGVFVFGRAPLGVDQTPDPEGTIDGLLVANNQTADYTLVLDDGGKIIECNKAASLMTLTVPTDASVAFPVGTIVELFQQSAQRVNVVPAGGVTLVAPAGAFTRGTGAIACLWKRDTDTWVLSGDLVP